MKREQTRRKRKSVGRSGARGDWDDFYERHECVPGEFLLYGIFAATILVLVVIGCR